MDIKCYIDDISSNVFEYYRFLFLKGLSIIINAKFIHLIQINVKSIFDHILHEEIIFMLYDKKKRIKKYFNSIYSADKMYYIKNEDDGVLW